MTLFAQQGYFATTIEQITKHAGVSKGLVYNYFPSKESLLIGLFEQATQAMQENVELLSKTKNLEDSISLFIDSFFSFLVNERQFLKFQLTLMLIPELNKILRVVIKKRAEFLLNLVSEWLVQLKIPEAQQKARLVLALLDGVSLHYLSIYENYPLPSMKVSVKNSLLKLVS